MFYSFRLAVFLSCLSLPQGKDIFFFFKSFDMQNVKMRLSGTDRWLKRGSVKPNITPDGKTIHPSDPWKISFICHFCDFLVNRVLF